MEWFFLKKIFPEKTSSRKETRRVAPHRAAPALMTCRGPGRRDGPEVGGAFPRGGPRGRGAVSEVSGADGINPNRIGD